MTKSLKLVVSAAILSFVLSGAAVAATYDTSLSAPGVYYGSGNSGLNTGWAVDSNGAVELGLSVNYRYIGQAAPDAGTNTYNVTSGFYTGPGGSCIGVCALWNFEFSVNLGNSGLNLGQVTTNISILNVGNGQSISFNPFLLPDNSAFDGTNTRNGNVSGQQATAADIGFQNSENLAWFGSLNPLFLFDPTANDTYIVTLSLTGPSGLNMSINETINATPLPATLPLLASGLGALGLLGWRKKRKNSAALAAV